MPGMSRKMLIAGVGNILLGDDGFGVELAKRLMQSNDISDSDEASIKIMETGIGGMPLVQELMYGYDVLILLDAYTKGGTPGHVYLLEPVVPDLQELDIHQKRDFFADTHYATPFRALALLTQVAALPDVIRIVGCEPEQLDDMKIGLSPPVAAAVDKAFDMVLELVRTFQRSDYAPQNLAR